MKPSVLLGLALLMGALAVFGVARWVGMGGAPRSGPSVVVAASAVEAGLPLGPQQLQVLVWPGPAPQGAYDSAAKLAGRVPRQALVPGEPVLESRLAPIDGKAGLSAQLQPGQRAITVRVNDVIGVAGFALPGTYVDVLVSARDARNEPFSRIVLDRVKVLAVAQETVSDPAKPKVVNAVTLELTPAQAERLDLARSVGSLSLALRNELDHEHEGQPSSGTRLEDLTRGAELASPGRAAAVPAEEPRRMPGSHAARAGRVPGVEEFRGTQRTTPSLEAPAP